MKIFFKSFGFLSLSSIVLFSGLASAAPVYMIAQIQIDNQEKYFSEYGAAVFPIMAKSGAKVLVATPNVTNLEGKWKGNWTVVLEFASEEDALEKWYNSDEYADVKELRYAHTSLGNLVIAPAFVPPAQ